LNVEALQDEILSCPVLVMLLVSVLVAGGTRAVKLSELYLAGRHAVYCSVCIDLHSVGYISKSSIDTWQADTLNSSPAFTSTLCGEDWLRSPGSVMSVVVALGNDITRRSGGVSSLIVDS